MATQIEQRELKSRGRGRDQGVEDQEGAVEHRSGDKTRGHKAPQERAEAQASGQAQGIEAQKKTGARGGRKGKGGQGSDAAQEAQGQGQASEQARQGDKQEEASQKAKEADKKQKEGAGRGGQKGEAKPGGEKTPAGAKAGSPFATMRYIPEAEGAAPSSPPSLDRDLGSVVGRNNAMIAGATTAAMSSTIPVQFVLHEGWGQTSLGKGAGDYGKYGEAFSQARFKGVLDAKLNGIQEGAKDGVIDALSGAAAKAGVKIAGKSIPGVGAMLAIGDGAVGMITFDWDEHAQRVKGLGETEAWDDDPWGQLADVLHLAADHLGLVGNVCNIVGGVLESVGLVAPPAHAIGLALVIIGDGIGLVKPVLGLYATTSRTLSGLTSDADARHINNSLKTLKDEAKDTVSGAIGLAVDGVSEGLGNKSKTDGGADSGAPEGKATEVDGSSGEAKGGNKKEPLEGGKDTLASILKALIEGDKPPANAPVVPRLRRWEEAQKRAALLQKGFNKGTGMMLFSAPIAAPAILGLASLLEPPKFQDLPGAPHHPTQMDKEAQELNAISGQSQQVELLMPQIQAQREEAAELSLKASETIASGQNMQDQLDAAERQLHIKILVQNQASAELSKLQADDGKVQKGQQDAQQALAKMREFVELVGAVPQELLPEGLARAVVQARAGLAQLSQGNPEQGNAHKDKGIGQLQEAKASAQSAQGALGTHQQEAASWIQTGEQARQALDQEEAELSTTHQSLAQNAQDLAQKAFALQASLSNKTKTMEAWAATHEAIAQQNDQVAVQYFGGTPSEDITAAGLTPQLGAARDAALADLRDCTAFCQQCIIQGAELTFDDANNAFQAHVRSSKHHSAKIGRDAENLAREGVEDLGVLSNELVDADPEELLQIIARAFDATGRLRSRLRLGTKGTGIDDPPPTPPKHGDGEDPPPPKRLDGTLDPRDDTREITFERQPNVQLEDTLVRELPRIEPITVFFHHDQPSFKTAGASVLESGEQAKLQTFAVKLAQGQGGAISAVGHASTEGTRDYNQQLARRRIHFVEQALRGAGSAATIQSTAVGEGHEVFPGTANHDQAVNPQHEPRQWRKVDLQVQVQPTPKTPSEPKP